MEGFVRIKSKRVCHRHLRDKIGEIFGYSWTYSGALVYGVSCGEKDYEFYEHELEEVKHPCEIRN